MAPRCLLLALLGWLNIAREGAQAAPATNAPAVGRALFLKVCAPCHGPDGSARTPAARQLGVKDLRPSRLPDDDIRRQIRDGILGSQGQQRMPAFRETLTPAQIDSLIPHVKLLRKAPPAAP